MARILHISFGYYPYWSGGMVQNQVDLMKNLEIIGHRVTYFTACRYDFSNYTYLNTRKISDIETIEMVNSPNPYDPYCYRTSPESHCANGIIENMTEEVLEQTDPDIVHIGDLRMHCASVIALLRNRCIPVVKTIHNFWDLCPKGDLMFNDEVPCVDFRNGEKCLICLLSYCGDKIPFMHRIKGSFNYQKYFPYIQRVEWIKTIVLGCGTRGVAKKKLPSARSYRVRREYFIKMLNFCTKIHTTSKNIARRFIDYGVDSQRIKTISLSAEGLSDIKSKINYEVGYPVIFGYRGKIHKRKGIEVLLSAFARLSHSKCKLMIFGDGDVSLLGPYTRKYSNIKYYGRYRKEQINSVLAKIDVGVVPSIWEEIFGLVGPEYINARIPVIASNIGGVNEWLIDGENGYLFKPGNSEELYIIMKRFVDEPRLIEKLQRQIKPWKIMMEYTQEISGLYGKIKG